jgi:hypothetical protein
MANKDGPRGFYPISPKAVINKFSPQKGYKMTASATVYEGDVVKIVDGGTVEAAAADIGTTAIGIAAEYKVAAASGDYYLKVYDCPDTVFAVQTDSGTATTAADVGETANHVAGSGSDTTKMSGHELDSSQMAASGGAQFKCLGLVDSPDNVFGEHSEWMVKFNEHFYSAAVAAV